MEPSNKIAVDELIIEITQECNLRCKHCMRDDATNLTISNDTISKIFSQISRINRLIITGGEPLCETNKIDYIVKVARKSNVPIYNWCIVTNGTICNESACNAIGNLNFYCVESNELPYFSKPILGQLVISDDTFHEKARSVAKISKQQFNYATEEFKIFTMAYGIQYLKYEANQLLNMGRARKLDFKNKIEVSLKPSFKLLINNFPDLEITGIVYMDANGNITPMNLSYEEQYKHIFGNIHNNTIAEIALIVTPGIEKANILNLNKRTK